MFTGIIEATGKVVSAQRDKSNLILEIEAPFVNEVKVDQSIAHNGVCLTVEKISGNHYSLTAIDETLRRTNLGDLKTGDMVNLERCMKAEGRFDGHIVQGHVDATGVCKEIVDRNGSTEFIFSYGSSENVTVEKGSITVNGISLTVVRSEDGIFSVAVIPYTLEHTNFKRMSVGDRVNLEFDVIGKYVQRLLKGYRQ